MQEFYDASEARAPEMREREQFAKMPELVARAMSAPGWAEQLAGGHRSGVCRSGGGFVPCRVERE